MYECEYEPAHLVYLETAYTDISAQFAQHKQHANMSDAYGGVFAHGGVFVDSMLASRCFENSSAQT